MQAVEKLSSFQRGSNYERNNFLGDTINFEKINDLDVALPHKERTSILKNKKMKYQTHSHLNANESLNFLRIEELKAAISRVEGNLYTAPLARDAILEELMVDGWSNQVTIDPHASITITSMKDRIGLCLQFGNMARFYADLLKLQHLYCSNRILGAFYIVPEKAYAKSLGSNLANDDRLTKELSIFETTITVPIMVFGVWN